MSTTFNFAALALGDNVIVTREVYPRFGISGTVDYVFAVVVKLKKRTVDCRFTSSGKDEMNEGDIISFKSDGNPEHKHVKGFRVYDKTDENISIIKDRVARYKDEKEKKEAADEARTARIHRDFEIAKKVMLKLNPHIVYTVPMTLPNGSSIYSFMLKGNVDNEFAQVFVNLKVTEDRFRLLRSGEWGSADVYEVCHSYVSSRFGSFPSISSDRYDIEGRTALDAVIENVVRTFSAISDSSKFESILDDDSDE